MTTGRILLFKAAAVSREVLARPSWQLPFNKLCRMALPPFCVSGGGLAYFAIGARYACPSLGACCLPDESCLNDLTLDECLALDGAFQGDGTDCDRVACSTILANDECFGAIDIPCGGMITASNASATVNPADPPFSCRFGGPGLGVGSLWYTFVATDTTARVSTCNSAVPDTLVAVYEGDCIGLTEIACSEDQCGLLSEVCVDPLSIGQTYYIRVASFDEASVGSITLEVACPCP